MRIAADTPTSITALAGTLVAVSADHLFEPGIAPSRLNAYVIREAEVMHEVAQKNWADAEMNSTRVAQLVPSDSTKIPATPPPASALSGSPWALSGIAKTTHSSRM